MGHFTELDVYNVSQDCYGKVTEILADHSIKGPIKDQISRASLSVSLNIAEGSGRFGKKDQRNFYVMARSSALECRAILDSMKRANLVENHEIQNIEE